MLHNPWRTRLGGYQGPPIDERGLTPPLEALARRKLGDEYRTGFGYGSCVVIGPRSVLKIAPFPVHRDRFLHEKAVSGISLPGVSMPSVVDEGVTDDYQWVEIERIGGRPAYEQWHDLSIPSQRRALGRLAECISIIQQFRPDERLLYARFDSWHDHVMTAFERAMERAASVVPDALLARANDFAERNGPQLAEHPKVLCHGDLWFGNIFLDDRGELSGIIDWDRLAIAPPDYEIDMMWRFWRYPWDFVPAEFESRFKNPMDPALLSEILKVSAPGLDSGRLNSRLSMLELPYRLGVTARFGWSDKHEQMLDIVLSGEWAARLLNG